MVKSDEASKAEMTALIKSGEVGSDIESFSWQKSSDESPVREIDWSDTNKLIPVESKMVI